MLSVAVDALVERTVQRTTKSVYVAGIDENVTDAAADESVLLAMSVYVAAIVKPLVFRRGWR